MRLVLVVLLVVVAWPSAATASTLFVDDDGGQCARADYASIQAAVDAARPKAHIRVCPGLYRESVTVDKPLTLRADRVAADCFTLPEPDPTRHAIVDGSGMSAQQLFDLRADDVTLKGLVLQGALSDPLPADYRLYRRAINTSDANSGYRIAHNVFRLNTVAIQFGASGEQDSRFDHNCVRQNRWGLAADDRVLAGARIDHNVSFRTFRVAFEPGVLGSVANVKLDHNRSRQDGWSYLVGNTTATSIVDNEITDGTDIGIELRGAHQRMLIARNRVTNNRAGLLAPGTLSASSIQDNEVIGNRGTGISLTLGSGNRIAGNMSSGNSASGLVLGAGFKDSHIHDNQVDGNGRHGIFAVPGATGHRIAHNSMHGNGTNPVPIPPGVDARDENTPVNEWVENDCGTDFPMGALC